MIRFTFVLLLFSPTAFADSATTPIPVVDSVTAWLTQSHIWLPMLGGLLSEITMRLFPTQKPLSWFHLVASGARQLASLLSGLANFLDQIFPQKLS